MSKLAPRPGYRPGDLDFRFRRAGYTLSIDVVKPGQGWWITASIHMGDVIHPAQPVFSHENIANCYLDAGGPIEALDGSMVETSPSLVVNGAHFTLRAAEYESLRKHLLPIGIVHHVRAPAPDAPPPAPPKPEYGPDSHLASRSNPHGYPDGSPQTTGEADGDPWEEGCGGDAVLDRSVL